MGNKAILGITIILVIIVAGGIYWFLGREEETRLEPKPEVKMAPQVEKVLDEKIKFVSELVKDPIIVNAARESNKVNAGLKSNEILALDKKWMDAEGDKNWVNSFLTSETAMRLIEFQEKNTGFSEIFISDAYGLIVGETNKTSDYFQADEDWWVKSYAGGEGKTYYGEIEFDESSQTESIPIFVPVFDPDTKKAIAVVKAIVDIVTIKSEL